MHKCSTAEHWSLSDIIRAYGFFSGVWQNTWPINQERCCRLRGVLEITIHTQPRVEVSTHTQHLTQCLLSKELYLTYFNEGKKSPFFNCVRACITLRAVCARVWIHISSTYQLTKWECWFVRRKMPILNCSGKADGCIGFVMVFVVAVFHGWPFQPVIVC